MSYKVKKEKLVYIKEPYGLPQDLTPTGTFKVKDERYYGWTNFNTWQVALNIDNDEGTYHASREAIKDGTITDGRSYKEWFKENFQSQEEGYYKIQDGWSENELNEVDWEEIYKNHKEEE